ncbi:MAG: adenylate kinase [Pseudolysinimonas sp.]|uniref:adenylate kinase n=1 Tax=Pseudolysinimonas sp. TaxID=2680009 RepID=UPI003C70C55F
MRTLLIGPPGSGKGTQGSLLSVALGVPTISTGDLFREHVRQGTALGREVEKVLADGGYVPDDITNSMIEGRLAAADTEQGFILDGYPRTRGQVEELDGVLASRALRLDAVVNLSVAADELEARLTLRGSRGGRADDRVGAIRGRIAIYEEVTVPLLDIYRERGIVIDADGRGDPTAVAAGLVRTLRNLTATSAEPRKAGGSR